MDRRAQSWDATVAETVLRHAPCGILVVTADTLDCVAANDLMVSLGLASAKSGPLAEVARRDLVDCLDEMVDECRITGAPHNVEQILQVDSKETWWLVSAAPLHDGSGQLTHLVCTFFYIDFLKRTEDALRRSEQTFRTLIERVPDAVLLADRRGVRYVNPAAVELLGLRSPDDVVGKSPMSLIDAVDRHDVMRSWRASFVGRGRRLVAARIVRADGGSVTVEFVPIPTVFAGDPCVLVVARDTTERNEIFARLAHADRTIALGTLAAGVAHEINNPLMAVQTNIGYVLEEISALESVPPKLEEAMVDALESLRRVAKTVRDLRELSRGDGSLHDVDVSQVIEQVVALARPEVERHGRLIVEPSSPVLVRASSLLSNVFLNLLLNAVQALVPGTPDNEIVIRARPSEAWVVVEVSDTGIGIPPEHLQRVFDPFFTTKPLGQGTGLGLALAQRIVESSGGRLVARSPGKGATFEVWLTRV